MTERRAILFVQHGDFAEAVENIRNGLPETYRDQYASVNFVSDLSSDYDVIVLAFGEQEYRVQISSGLVGLKRSRSSLTSKRIAEIFEEFRPTHLILRTPHTGFLREAAKRRIFVLPIFADIFRINNFKSAIEIFFLRRALRRVSAPCYSNHSLNASMSMNRYLKLPLNKILPWDWSRVPMVEQPKQSVARQGELQAFFAGALTKDKGVGDCLEAVKLLSDRGFLIRMSFAGDGDRIFWQDYAGDLGIASRVEFLGKISNVEVRALMRSHDFVIVPSRHEYPEGLPNTIYEALASRSVLLISDHPAFQGRLVPDHECLVFTAAQPDSLANAIERASGDQELYAAISRNSHDAHDRLYVGIEWSKVVSRFLEDPCDHRGWVEGRSLQSIIETMSCLPLTPRL